MTSRRLPRRWRATRLPILLLLAAIVPATASVAQDIDPPHPDPAALHRDVPGEPCTVANEYESALFGVPVGEARYGDLCKRITFAFGPIVVKPGQNDALLQPLTMEKPAYDGFITRFKVDLLKAVDGQPPPTDHMHLHHATWSGVSADGNYGLGPIYAAGEEKTWISTPEGYGHPVSADDVWLLLYMVHNELSDTQVVWLTYQVDYVAAEDAATLDILPARQIWLDVQGQEWHPEAPGSGGNPVFNVQRGFGHIDPESGRKVCTWPKENCARHGPLGQVTVQQGTDVDSEGNPVVVPGTDLTVPADMAGTIVHIGGHTHPGGIRDEISLVRGGVEKPIFLSDALYWDWDDPSRVGGPPWSWNFAMTVTPVDYRVRIKEGDVLRINNVTDSTDGSWYENMGISMMWVATDGTHGEPSVDVFDEEVVLDRGAATSAPRPEGPYDALTGWRPPDCEMDLQGDAGAKTLCLRGGPTHGPLPESSHTHGGCPTPAACPDLTAVDGELTDTIVSFGFTYGNADLGAIDALGIPLLKVGQPARFYNLDAPARIWHTFTRCAYPCNGLTSVAYPIAGGGRGDPADVMDFDSSEIGFGTIFESASGQFPSSTSGKTTEQAVRDSVYWEFTPTETGTYTFYCRIHHGMRGAFRVVD